MNPIASDAVIADGSMRFPLKRSDKKRSTKVDDFLSTLGRAGVELPGKSQTLQPYVHEGLCSATSASEGPIPSVAITLAICVEPMHLRCGDPYHSAQRADTVARFSHRQ